MPLKITDIVHNIFENKIVFAAIEMQSPRKQDISRQVITRSLLSSLGLKTILLKYHWWRNSLYDITWKWITKIFSYKSSCLLTFITSYLISALIHSLSKAQKIFLKLKDFKQKLNSSMWSARLFPNLAEFFVGLLRFHTLRIYLVLSFIEA